MSVDVGAFLRARLDEDEQVARAAQPEQWYSYFRQVMAGVEVTLAGEPPADPDDVAWVFTKADAKHIARHDPARVLREVEAKRAILVEHEPRQETVGYRGPNEEPIVEWTCPTCVYFSDDEDSDGNRYRDMEHDRAPCTTLRLLVAPYADHPDYQQGWSR